MNKTFLLGAASLALATSVAAQPGTTQILDRQSTGFLSTSGADFGNPFVNTAADGFLENAGDPSLAPTSLLVYQASLDNGLFSMSSATLRLQTSTDGGKTFAPAANDRAVYTFNADLTNPGTIGFFGFQITAYENHVFIFVIDDVVDAMGMPTGTNGVYAIGSDDQGQTFSDPVLLSTYSVPAVANAPGSIFQLEYPGYLGVNPSGTFNLDDIQNMSADSSLASASVGAPLTNQTYASCVWEAQFEASPASSGFKGFDNPDAGPGEEEAYFQTVYVERVMGLPVLRTAFPNEVVLTEDMNGLGLHVADVDLDGPGFIGNKSVVCDGDVVAVAISNEDDPIIGAPALDRNTVEVRVSVDASLSFANTLAPSIRVDDFSAANPSPRQSNDMAITADNGKVYLLWGATQTLDSMGAVLLSGADTPTLAVIDTNSGTPVLDPMLSGSVPVVWPNMITTTGGTMIDLNSASIDPDGFNISVQDGVIVMLMRLELAGAFTNSNEVVAFVDRNDGADVLARSTEFIQLTDDGVQGFISEADFKNAVYAGTFSQGGNADGDQFLLLSTDGGATFRKERVTDGADETSPGAGDSEVNFGSAQLALTQGGSVHLAMQDLQTGPIITTGQRYPRLERELVTSGPTMLETYTVRDAVPGSAVLLFLNFSGLGQTDLSTAVGLNGRVRHADLPAERHVRVRVGRLGVRPVRGPEPTARPRRR